MSVTYKEELFRTPEILLRTLRESPESKLISAQRLIFVGCGTSLYIGGQLARLCLSQGRNAVALDLEAVLEHPFPLRDGDAVIAVSRSGRSRETVLAVKRLLDSGAWCFYLGCTPGSIIDGLCSAGRIIPWAEEKLVLESYSYYAQMLLGALCCSLEVSPDIPDLVGNALALGERLGREVLERSGVPSRIISLSSGFYASLHREMMLKDGEITQLPAESWGNLEFRHGPRSWVDGTTLIHMIPGTLTSVWDRHVAEELVSYGCPVLYYDAASPEGAVAVDLSAPRESLAEVLAAGAFHTAVATEISLRRRTSPEQLRHVIHNVGNL